MPSSRAFSWPRDWTGVSHIAGRFFTAELPGKHCASTSHASHISLFFQCIFLLFMSHFIPYIQEILFPEMKYCLEWGRQMHMFVFIQRSCILGKKRKKGIFSACLRIKFLYNLCGLSFKKERRRKGRRKGRRKDLTENLFPNSSLMLVTFGDKWQMLNFPIPSPNDRFVFLWSIYAGKRFISDVN